MDQRANGIVDSITNRWVDFYCVLGGADDSGQYRLLADKQNFYIPHFAASSTTYNVTAVSARRMKKGGGGGESFTQLWQI